MNTPTEASPDVGRADQPALREQLDHSAQNEAEAQAWLDAGYEKDAILLAPGDKRPKDQAWPDKIYSREEIIEGVRNDYNLGLRLDPYFVADVEDSEVAPIICEVIEEHYPTAPKRSRPGSNSCAYLFARDPNNAAPPMSIPRPAGITGTSGMLLEFLTGHGKQLHISGRRKDKANARIEWNGPPPKRNDLPPFGMEDHVHLTREIEEKLQGRGYKITISTGGRSSKPASDTAPVEQMSEDMLRKALASIPNDDAFRTRDAWVEMLHAIFGASGGSDWGKNVGIEWSEQVDQKPGEPERVWNSFSLDTCRAGAGFIRKQLALRGNADLHDEARQQAAADLFDDDLPPRDETDARSGMVDGKHPVFTPTVFVGRDPGEIPQRCWIYDQHLIRRFSAATIAGGGVGKTALKIIEAISMASGRSLMGVPVGPPVRVWLINGEDPAEEMERRIAAALRHHGVAPEELGDRLLVNSGRERGMRILIAEQIRGETRVNRPLVRAIKAAIKKYHIDVVIIDPFISFHAVSENDNPAIDKVMKVLNEIADECDCAIEVCHHVRKLGGAETTVEDGRGASALKDAARSIRVLNVMTQDEAQKAGVSSRRSFVRIDSGKGNLAPPPEHSRWFHLANHTLPNGEWGGPGDDVGVAEPWDWPSIVELVSAEDTLKIQERIGALPRFSFNSQASLWAGHEIGEVLGLNTMDRSDRAARARAQEVIKSMLKDGTLKRFVQRDKRRGCDVAYIVAGNRPPETF